MKFFISESEVIAFGVVIASAIISALILTPLIRMLFLRIGISDRPDANRKLQKETVSLGGGLAVFIATIVAAAAGFVVLDRTGESFSIIDEKVWTNVWTLLAAATAILILGLLDDAITLRGRQKLLGQILIVTFLIGTGTLVHSVELLGYKIDLGFMAIPLTMAWLLGAINAVNLIDGADGIASTAGAIICTTLAIMAFLAGLMFESIVSASMAAALVGFLYFNWPPAKIYLGDAGSMLIGLVVGLFAIWSNLKHSTTIAFAVPLAALSIPLFDSAVAILRRAMTGRSIYSADRGHLHHQLSTRFSPQKMLMIVGGLCFLTGAAAVISIITGLQWLALAGTLVVIGGLVASGLFGKAEFGLAARKMQHFTSSLMTRSHHADTTVRQQTTQLQGSRRWDEIWSALTEFSGRHQLCRMRLDLNLSWLHEGYHGDWRTLRQPDRAEQWSISLPVLSSGRLVGKLDIAGRVIGYASFQSMETLAALLQDLQPSVDRLFAEIDGRLPNPNSSSTAELTAVSLADTPSEDEIACAETIGYESNADEALPKRRTQVISG